MNEGESMMAHPSAGAFSAPDARQVRTGASEQADAQAERAVPRAVSAVDAAAGVSSQTATVDGSPSAAAAVGVAPAGASSPEDASWHRYPFMANRACPYFPCHDDLDPAEFNCLFCYCPLYALGPRCGGRFRYTEAGVKDCTPCSLPHRGDAGTELVKRHFKDLAGLVRVPAAHPAKVLQQQGRAEEARRTASSSDPEARLSEVLAAIPETDDAAARAARAQWNSIAKPIGSLGMLEDAIVRIAALTGDADVRLDRRICTVFCADNGVVAEGVSQCGSEVTTSVATAIAAGTSSICSMARPVQTDALAVDVGMETPSTEPRVLDRAVRRGTGDIAQGPALSRAEAASAVLVGVDLVRELRDQGYRIIASGEMGIGNTTTSSAVASVLLGEDPRVMVGRGAGLSDEGLERKRRAVERALSVNRPCAADPLGVIASVGGLDIAALCGLFIGGARWRIPIIVDGFISSVAALSAVRMNARVAGALVASHLSSEPAAALVMDALGLEAPIHAGLRLGEGTGAVCLIPLLDQACALYHGATFGDEGIEPYEVDPK